MLPDARAGAVLRRYGGFAAVCGVCDFCDPGSVDRADVPARDGGGACPYGGLHEALKGRMGSLPAVCIAGFPSWRLDRRGFEDLLNAMARAGLVQVIDSSFEKDGRRIDSGKCGSTRRTRGGGRRHVTIPEEVAAVPSQRKSRKTAKSRRAAREAKASPKREALRAWRTAEAKKKGVPAFRIMSDRVLDGILGSSLPAKQNC